jgi:hypothetical protein
LAEFTVPAATEGSLVVVALLAVLPVLFTAPTPTQHEHVFVARLLLRSLTRLHDPGSVQGEDDSVNAHAFLGDFYNFLDKNDTNTWKDRVVCGKGVNEEATKVIQEHLTSKGWPFVVVSGVTIVKNPFNT